MSATASPAQEPAMAQDAALPAAGSSFYTAMRLLPKDRREAMYAVYAFCRSVDDVADDGRLLVERHDDPGVVRAHRPLFLLARPVGASA